MISPLEEEEEGGLKEDLLHQKHRELKERVHSIQQGFERLRRVSHQGYDASSGRCGAPSPLGCLSLWASVALDMVLVEGSQVSVPQSLALAWPPWASPVSSGEMGGE